MEGSTITYGRSEFVQREGKLLASGGELLGSSRSTSGQNSSAFRIFVV